jgi:endonuclease YncB( thermonuclease family)
MSSENDPVRKAWIRHARSLVLRKWLLIACGVAFVAWAAVAIVHYRKPAGQTTSVSSAAQAPKRPSAQAPKPGEKKAATPSAQPESKVAPPVASKPATPPPSGLTPASSPAIASSAIALRSAPAGESALILGAPLAPSPALPVQLPPQGATTPSGSPSPASSNQAVPDLPTVAVAEPGFHVVPSDRATKWLGTVTMSERNGRTFTIVPAAPAPQPAASRPTPAMVARAAPAQSAGFAPVVANPAVFSGHARVTGALMLDVQGQAVMLFGVQRAEPQDRCAASNGRAQSCATLAQAALAHRLAGHSIVACRVPPGQRGQLGAICLDEQGNDLGRFLVIEGLALADSTQSYDYLPAEGAARSAKRGLWRFR